MLVNALTNGVCYEQKNKIKNKTTGKKKTLFIFIKRKKKHKDYEDLVGKKKY